MKHGEIIKISGEEKKVYLCDRQKECNTSEFCGNICKHTTDVKHACPNFRNLTEKENCKNAEIYNTDCADQ